MGPQRQKSRMEKNNSVVQCMTSVSQSVQEADKKLLHP